MEYWKIINQSDDTANETSKFRARNWVESWGPYDKSNQTKLETSMNWNFSATFINWISEINDTQVDDLMISIQ